MRSYLAAQDEPFLDKHFLEKFIDVTNADRMRISISDGSMTRQLWFDLKTRQVTHVQILRDMH